MKRMLALLAVTAIAIFCFRLIESPLRAADGSSGISLFYAQVSFPAAMGLLLLGMVIPFALCVGLGCWGNPLRGVFAMCLALAVLGHRGGGMANWMRTHELPGAYGVLIVELLIWSVLLGALVGAIHLVRKALAGRYGWIDPRHRPLWRLDVDTFGAGVTAAAVGAILTWFIVQTADVGQVVWGLGLSFLLAGFVAHYIWPAAAPGAMLAAPLVVGVGGYLATLVLYSTHPEVLAAFYGSGLHGHAKALPVHYASAAMVGLVIGIAWRQVLAEGERESDNQAESTQPSASASAVAGESR